jgi:hypothetical protein
MIQVTVRVGKDQRSAKVDPNASLAATKRSILATMASGANPEDYDIVVVPRNRNPPLGSIGIQEGDLILVSLREDVQGDPVLFD